MNTIQKTLLTLIIVGMGFLVNQKLWVPKLVNIILESEEVTEETPAAKTNDEALTIITSIIKLNREGEFLWSEPMVKEEVYRDWSNFHSGDSDPKEMTLKGYEIKSNRFDPEKPPSFSPPFLQYYYDSLSALGWEDDSNLVADGPGSA